MDGSTDDCRRGEDTFKQFASVDSGFLAWDFWLKDADDRMASCLSLKETDKAQGSWPPSIAIFEALDEKSLRIPVNMPSDSMPQARSWPCPQAPTLTYRASRW